MKWIRKRALAQEILTGSWLNLGSSLTAEMAGQTGVDWVLIDLEHGAGDHDALLYQLQALEGSPAAPIVRIAWNETPRFKRVLDLGPSGVMVPYVNTPEEARQAVAAMRYPPGGIRGVARFNRACGFGQNFNEYQQMANDNLLTIIQIETGEAVSNVNEIAAIDGVDVLFVGPMDLSFSLGCPQQFDHADYRDALKRVLQASRNAGKAAGILFGKAEQIAAGVEDGFTFIAFGSDGSAAAEGLKKAAAELEKVRVAEVPANR